MRSLLLSLVVSLLLWNVLESGGGVVECQTTASPNSVFYAYYSPSSSSQPAQCSGDAVELHMFSASSSSTSCPTGTPLCQHPGDGSNSISHCSSQTLQTTADQTFGGRPYAGFTQFLDAQCSQVDYRFAVPVTRAPSISAAPCVGVIATYSVTGTGASFQAVVTSGTASPTVTISVFASQSCSTQTSNYNFVVSDVVNAATPPCLPTNGTLGAGTYWQPIVSKNVLSSGSSMLHPFQMLVVMLALTIFVSNMADLFN